MRFVTGLSDAANAMDAADQVCRDILAQLAGAPCDLACVFISSVYRASWPDLVARIHDRLAPRTLIGCTGSGVIGAGQELEWVPGLSIAAARLPDVQAHPFAIAPDELEQSGGAGFWVDKIGASPAQAPSFILLADPLTCQPQTLLNQLGAAYRGVPAVGGLASGGNEPGEHALFLGTQVLNEGAVGVALTGNITMDTVVSQGCRPVGRPYIITKAEDNVVIELGGRQALAVLHEVLSGLPADDRELAQHGSIFIGLAINEMKAAMGSGDFLIRNIVGIDPDQGAIAVAEDIGVGQTLQFQLRDPGAARQELRRQLQALPAGPAAAAGPPAGVLLFNCSGRGRSLYGTPHQDVRTIQTISGRVPIGGFFCNGEIGPAGGSNFVHSYTASVGLFRPVRVASPAAPMPGPLGATPS